MDTRDGKIYEPEAVEGLKSKYLKQMVIPPTRKQMARTPPKVGRNEPCPCGSGHKFKRCCLVRQPGMRRIEVLRNDRWVVVDRLHKVKAGERFRMFEPGGESVKDDQGLMEWIAATDGNVRGDGIGQIEVRKGPGVSENTHG